jgi:hypothetical protein
VVVNKMPERMGSVVLDERPFDAIDRASSNSERAMETFIPVPFI